MNSLLVKAGIPQMRCVAVPSSTCGSFSYEVMIGGSWVPCNYQFAVRWVGYVTAQRKKVDACQKKSKSWTGVTKIGGAFWSTSWDLIDPANESSTCEKGMSMNAPIQLRDSVRGSRGFYER
ncbi:Uncharacterised protein [Ewingella americana]|uniref:Uncharacterized protein n=1 Tax=Ewingella americana TaxID=41202 RepID=A0A377TC45_9GAMM|nr:Uncharacterised protein [Ewingella americana]